MKRSAIPGLCHEHAMPNQEPVAEYDDATARRSVAHLLVYRASQLSKTESLL